MTRVQDHIKFNLISKNNIYPHRMHNFEFHISQECYPLSIIAACSDYIIPEHRKALTNWNC